jgi:ribosomal protein L11 methyltransferase
LLCGFFFAKMQWMKEAWTQIRVEIHPHLLDAVANFLIEQGSPGVSQEKVSGSPGRKRERLVAYFPGRLPIGPIRKKIRAYVSQLCRPHRSSFTLNQRRIVDPGWGEAWKEYFKPLRVSPHLVVKPPWEHYRPKEKDLVIEIDPGMAFGTGSHPTTRMCLQVLEEVMRNGRPAHSVLDVGTGSGILAIAARKMGARHIVAVDIDPVAIQGARENAALNKVSAGIHFRTGSLEGIRATFDLVLANLLPQELLGLIPALARRVSARGAVIVSGFLGRQKKEIAKAMEKERLEIQAARTFQGWHSFVLRPGARR